MFKDIKNKFKSTPSIRSVKSDKSQTRQQLPTSASTPVLSSMTSVPPPLPAHSLRESKGKSPYNSHSSTIDRQSFHSVISHKKPRSRSSCQSISEEDENTSSSSSVTSLSMPPTPPTNNAMIQHSRYPSNVSLPMTHMSELIMNHDHLKPGDNAELLSYNKTINMYRENAKRTNDPTIQCDLAMFLYESSKKSNPEEKKVLVNDAVKILKTLALRGHAESQYYLANMFASGHLHKSGKPDFGNAFPLFVQAAKHQHVDAAYRAAKCYEDGLGCLKNKSKAVQYYKLAATLNHPGAMYRLGLANINGELGLQRNVRDGNKWLKRSAVAATAEYPHALHELGLLHEKGYGGIIFKDPKYSVQLYAHAADLGYAPSAYRLGQCFEYGYLGCQKDASSSIFYYTIAARHGHAEACFALSAWYLSGDEDYKKIEPNEDKALYWAKAAAEKGLAKAEFALGYFAEMGIGRAKNQQDAIAFYKKAAEQGDEQAKQRLAKVNLPPTPSHVALPSALVVAGEAR